MDSFHSQTHDQQHEQQQQDHQYHHREKQNAAGKRLMQEQVRVLERNFSANKKLLPDLKSELASQLGVPPRQVAVWYQNRRARWKAQTLELDHSTLQLKLETATAGKRRLESEVARLSHELAKANAILHQMALMSGPIHHHHHHPHPSDLDAVSRPIVIDRNNSCSSSSDHQWGISYGMNNNINNNNNGGGGGGGEVLQLDDDDELYASFMMGGGGGGGSGSTGSWD